MIQVEYTIAVTQLHASLQTPLRPLEPWINCFTSGRFRHQRDEVRWQGAVPKIQVHSICHYRPDPTSRTGRDCPLPELSVPNHRAYSDARYLYIYIYTYYILVCYIVIVIWYYFLLFFFFIFFLVQFMQSVADRLWLSNEVVFSRSATV